MLVIFWEAIASISPARRVLYAGIFAALVTAPVAAVLILTKEGR